MKLAWIAEITRNCSRCRIVGRFRGNFKLKNKYLKFQIDGRGVFWEKKILLTFGFRLIRPILGVLAPAPFPSPPPFMLPHDCRIHSYLSNKRNFLINNIIKTIGRILVDGRTFAEGCRKRLKWDAPENLLLSWGSLFGSFCGLLCSLLATASQFLVCTSHSDVLEYRVFFLLLGDSTRLKKLKPHINWQLLFSK